MLSTNNTSSLGTDSKVLSIQPENKPHDIETASSEIVDFIVKSENTLTYSDKNTNEYKKEKDIFHKIQKRENQLKLAERVVKKLFDILTEEEVKEEKRKKEENEEKADQVQSCKINNLYLGLSRYSSVNEEKKYFFKRNNANWFNLIDNWNWSNGFEVKLTTGDSVNSTIAAQYITTYKSQTIPTVGRILNRDKQKILDQYKYGLRFNSFVVFMATMGPLPMLIGISGIISCSFPPMFLPLVIISFAVTISIAFYLAYKAAKKVEAEASNEAKKLYEENSQKDKDEKDENNQEPNQRINLPAPNLTIAPSNESKGDNKAAQTIKASKHSFFSTTVSQLPANATVAGVNTDAPKLTSRVA